MSMVMFSHTISEIISSKLLFVSSLFKAISAILFITTK